LASIQTAGKPAKPARRLRQPALPFWRQAKISLEQCALFLSLALVILFAAFVTASNKRIFSESYTYSQKPGQEASFVTPVFEVAGHTSNIELKISTDLENNWTYFNFALINDRTAKPMTSVGKPAITTDVIVMAVGARAAGRTPP